MKRNDGDSLVPLEGLADQSITRARAIKLLGAMAGTGAFALFLPDEADARRRRPRRPRRRRRRRRARVARPTTTPVALAPGVDPTINITNPSRDQPLTIRNVRVVDANGDVIGTAPLVGGPVTIRPRRTAPVQVDLGGLSVAELLQADGFRLIDGRGVPITVVDENGVQVGDIPVDVSAL